MTTKDYLQQLKYLKILIDSKREQWEMLNVMRDGMGAVGYGNERVQSSGVQDVVVKAVELMAQVQESLYNEQLAYTQLYAEINQKIQQLPDLQFRAVLVYKYMDELTFEQLAEKMGYSVRNAHYLHGRAIASFEKEFGELYKAS